jgi:hypothetical protein
MPKPLIAERFTRAFSGSYWQVAAVEADPKVVARPAMRSRSLWDKTLPISANTKPGEVRKGYVTGPISQHLRYVERVVSIARPETEGAEAGMRLIAATAPPAVIFDISEAIFVRPF